MTEDSALDRLHHMLFGPGPSEAPVDVATVWNAVQAWWRTPIAGLPDTVEEALGFEASLASSDATGWISLAFFRQVGAGELGIELWFPVDDVWRSAMRESNWDWTHPIGFHAWGEAGPGASGLSSVVQRSALFRAALQRPCRSARLFATPDREIVIGEPPPAH